MRPAPALASLALAAAWAAGSAGHAAEPPALLLVGDSTMAPTNGYGDALCQRVQAAVSCLNLAKNGRSSHSYRAEGLWAAVMTHLQAAAPGVPRYVLIQFGHNDQPGKPGRSTDLASEYPANLARYVADVRQAGGTPLLVTPLARRSFKEGRLVPDLAPWAQAVREVARTQAVALIDLNASSSAAVQAMGPAQADLMAQGPVGSPTFDRTHLGPRGACVFADQVLAELPRHVPGLRVAESTAPCYDWLPPTAAAASSSPRP